MKSKVYFTKNITPQSLVEIYKKLGVKLEGKVGVKVHSGEKGNQNFLRPEFLKEIISFVNGTVIECNTAYEGMRNTTQKHKELLKLHGWSKLYTVDILDSEGEIELPIPNGKVIKKNYVGSHLTNYDSILVISHFKGHPMGGFGGALKNISIGLASSHGKAYIHGAGKPENFWSANHDDFLRSMADASKSIMDLEKGKIAFINVMCNMSVDCDCCEVAKAPKIADIGVLASLDPVALDRACVDLVYSSTDKGKADLIERIESRNGTLIIKSAAELKIGNEQYELVSIDK